MTEWHDIHSQLLDVLKGELELQLNTQPASFEAVHRALLAGLLSNVCQRKEQGEYLGTRGQKVHIHPGSGQFKARPPWILCSEQVETTRVYARGVARIDPLWVERVGAHLVKQHHYDPHWERRGARVAVHERTTLFGLTLQSGRRIPYERVDAKSARDLFIRHALVQMDYDSRAPFFTHNLKLLEDTEYLQQKGRRVDLLVDESQLHAFFDARIPAEVCNGASFERWRREAEARDPDLLKLRPADISGAADPTADAWKFPDHLQAGPLRIPLEYRFEPGHVDDGVSARVPLHMLNQLSAEAFSWLVPGLLEEKVTALVRSLPKALRVHFVPAPQHAGLALALLQPGKGSLHAQLAAALQRSGGVPVPGDAFRDELLPAHLRMNYLLVDDQGKVIDRDRDLRALQQRQGQRAVADFQQLAERTATVSGHRQWDFGDLPETFEGLQQGRKVFGYLAVCDEGASVGTRICATPAEAGRQHRRGLVRLVRLVQSREFKALRKDLAVNVQAELAYRKLEAHPLLSEGLAPGRDLRDDLLDALAAAVFLDGQPVLRHAAAFEQRVATCRAGLGLPAQEISRGTQLALEALQAAHASLKQCRHAATVQDVAAQLARLVPAGYLLTTPWVRLRELPRYLKAIAYRLDKAAADPARDAKLAAEVATLETRYWQGVTGGKDRSPPQEDAFRWLLEEYRVSLFAQHLKTPVPVSARRLQDAWSTRTLGK
jgi:ATP-dependent helicase HrpA